MAENPEENNDAQFDQYMKELDIEDDILTSKTFSVHADREYQQQLFILKEMQIAQNEKEQLASKK
jgi:hypothetical protein